MIRALGTLPLVCLLVTACDPIWRHRVVVVTAASPGLPIRDAAVRVECPSGVPTGHHEIRALKSLDGSETGFWAFGFGLDPTCVYIVEAKGYVVRSYKVQDICADSFFGRCNTAALRAELRPLEASAK